MLSKANATTISMTRSQMVKHAAHEHYNVPIVLFQMDEQFWKEDWESCSPSVPRLIPICPNTPSSLGHGFNIAQLPLVPADAITTHKLQGLTFKTPKKLVLDLTHPLSRGQKYTVLSRNQLLEDVAIVNNYILTPEELNDQRYADDVQIVNAEYTRLRDLDQAFEATDQVLHQQWAMIA